MGAAGRFLGRFAARNWAFLVVFAAGAAMRAVVLLAYRPALFFYDSFRYLTMVHTGDPGENSPLGYPWFLLGPLLRVWPSVTAAPVANHVLGLLIAVGAYVLLRRWGTWPWLAALATAPVLLDAYQLQIEQLIMSDTLFEALLVAVLLVLARRRPGPVLAVIGGAVLAAAVVTRFVGLACGAVAVAYLLLAARGRLRRVAAAAALAVTLAVPVGLYAAYYHAWYGVYRLSPADAAAAYARVAPFADCRGLELPDYERVLCETTPPEHRPGPEFYHWGPSRPSKRLHPPPGRTKDAVLADFTARIIRHQPLSFAWTVSRDVLRGFAWTKETAADGPRVERWHFPAVYYDETYDPSPFLERYGDPPLTTDPALAAFLVRYQQVAFLRGTVVGGCLVIALLGAVGVGRARRSGARAACALVAGLPFCTLVVAALVEFSWRYQLPAIVILPVAGALGLTAMLRRTEPAVPAVVGSGAGTAVAADAAGNRAIVSPTLGPMNDPIAAAAPSGAAASRVLVTGGSGFIGRSVVQALLADGHTVVNADLRPGGEHTAGAVEVIGDLTDPAVRERAVGGTDGQPVDAIVHLAAVTRVLKSVEDPVGTHALNVEATAGLLELARTNGVGTFVLASTNAVVGDVGRDTITEDHPLRPLTPYGATKAAGEMLLSAYTAVYAIGGCALRFSNVYGPGMNEKDSFVPRLMRAALAGTGVEIYGDGEQVRDLVHVDDTVQAVRLALAGKLTGTAIVGSGRSVSVNDLVAAARQVTGAAIPVEHVPAKPGEMPAVIVDVSRSRGQGYEPQHTLESGLATVWDDFRAAAGSAV